MTLDDVGVIHVQVDYPGGDPPARRLTVDTDARVSADIDGMGWH
jgi:hypothetical protein